MKTIVLGDIHGRTIWKDIISKEDFDRLIFIGDYFDTHENISVDQQIENFKDIIDYKDSSDKEIILLTGNHDFHYLPKIMEHYSGYNNLRAKDITTILEKNLDKLQMCYKIGNILFTHAGITSRWLKDNKYDNEIPVDKFINDLFINDKNNFSFYGFDPYGDDVTQSPIWVRPASLMKNAFRYEDHIQVMGHTTMNSIQPVKERYYFIDTLGTSREYLLITDYNIFIEKI